MNTAANNQEKQYLQTLSEVNREFEQIAGTLLKLDLKLAHQALCQAYHAFEHEVFIKIKAEN